MQWGLHRRAVCVAGGSFWRPLAALACMLALAGCNAAGNSNASLMGSRGATVAFESIDGPPPDVFRRLVKNLNDEAEGRQLAVVSHGNPSAYRVRGYLAAATERGKTSISWLWDVYDADHRRAFRITGAETLPGKPRDPWSATDDAVLRRIAGDSMTQLAGFLNTSAPAPAGPQLASLQTDESSPEAAGIFRIFHAKADPEPGTRTADATAPEPHDRLGGAVPLPPRRPASAVSHANIAAYAALER